MIGAGLSLLVFGIAYRQATIAPPRPDAHQLVLQTEADQQMAAARRLSADEITRLEAAVTRNPEDLQSRARLLGAYAAGNDPLPLRRHMLWMIQTHPDGITAWGRRFNPVLDPSLDPEGYEEGRKLWLARLTRHHIPVEELRNAAAYFKFTDAVIAQKLLLRAEAKDDAVAYELGEEYYSHLADGPAWHWAKPYGNGPGQGNSIQVVVRPGKS